MADRWIEIQGLEQTLRWMDKMPQNCLNLTTKSMKRAVSATAKQIRNRTPRRWRKLVKPRAKLQRSGTVLARTGWIDTGQQSSSHGKSNPPTDWFKAYWLNYGTLEGRDSNHEFKYPVKKATTAAASRRKNKRGNVYQHFYERSIIGWQEKFREAFNEAMVKYQDEFRKY